MSPAFPGFAQSLRPGLCRYPPRVTGFTPPVRYICLGSPDGNPLWPHTVLCRRLCPYGLVELLPPQHPAITVALRHPKSGGLTPRCGLLHPQDRTDSLAYVPGQGPTLDSPDPPRWICFPPQERAEMARTMVYPFSGNHPPLH